MIKNWFQKNYNETSLEKKLLSQLNRNRLPNPKQLKYLNKFLNKQERLTLIIASVVFVVSFLFLSYSFVTNHLEVIPGSGGKYTEGSLITPSYINPIYNGSNITDDSLIKLIYSSLWQRDNNGSLSKDLVEDYQISEDQKTYTITITNKATWHSGETLTTADVLFTFNTIKDIRFKSPLRRYFLGVEAEIIDDTTIKFILVEPYSPFLELLTFGILPKHLWQDISPNNINLAQINIRPVGSGPYKFKSLSKDKNGNLKTYTLQLHKNYHKQQPLISEVNYKFFVSIEELFDALNNNRIDSANYLPNNFEEFILAPNSFNIHKIKQPQLIGVYFNLATTSILSDKSLRQALAHAINKEEIKNELYLNNADIANSPITDSSFAYTDQIRQYTYDPELAKKILTDSNWKLETNTNSTSTVTSLKKNGQVLEIELTTIDTEDGLKLAEKIATYWQAIGVKVTINSVDKNSFYTQVVKPKKYSVLIYNTFNTLNTDPYPFWDSSQVDTKGFNLSNYSNPNLDKLIESARVNNDIELREKNYHEFQKIISEELPAIFLLSPRHIYLQNKKIKGFNVNTISVPEDIYYNTINWYTEEKKSLKF